MSHNYHQACGCAACSRTEEQEEARDEYIEEYAPREALKLLGREGFAEGALNDLSYDQLAGFATDLGTFFERFHNEETDAGMAAAGYDLYRRLKPYVEAAALEQAREDVAAEYDRLEAA